MLYSEEKSEIRISNFVLRICGVRLENIPKLVNLNKLIMKHAEFVYLSGGTQNYDVCGPSFTAVPYTSSSAALPTTLVVIYRTLITASAPNSAAWVCIRAVAVARA